MQDIAGKFLWVHHMDELAIFKKCVEPIGHVWTDLLDSLKYPDGEKTRKQVRARYVQAVEWFDMAVSSTGLTGPEAFLELKMPPYLGSAFGVPHFGIWRLGGPENKVGRYIYEPASRLRWPSLRMLAVELGTSDAAICAALKKDRKIKRRYFQHAIKRVE